MAFAMTTHANTMGEAARQAPTMGNLHLSFEWLNATSVLLQIKVIPRINALWGGMILLIIGLEARFLAWPNVQSNEKRAESWNYWKGELNARHYNAMWEG